MTNPLNPRIRQWLDTGNATAALMGQGRYFVRDHDYGAHDRLLVLNQLLTWASEDHRAEAAASLAQAHAELLRSGREVDAAYQLLAYLIVARDRRIGLLTPKVLKAMASDLRTADSGRYPSGMLQQIGDELAITE